MRLEVFPIGLPYGRPSEQATGIVDMAHVWATTVEVGDVVGYGSPAERFAADIVTKPIGFEDGIVHLPEGPGLGVEVDDGKLARYGINIQVN